MIGYGNIPDYWKQGIEKVENMNFRYTEMSLKKVYDTGFRHAVEMIKRNGGVENGDSFIIQYQVPQIVPLEIGFEGIYPTEKRTINTQLLRQTDEISFDITGSGFALTGYAATTANQKDEVLEADIYIDNNFIETVKMPTLSLIRRYDVAWNYDLPEGKHSIIVKTRNIPDGYFINIRDLIVYSDKNPGKHVYF
jgi:hypothetical protein